MAIEEIEPGIWAKTIENLTDSGWWGDNLAAFLVFSIGVGLAVSSFSALIAAWKRRPYQGWKLEVTPEKKEGTPDRPAYANTLLWDEVRKFAESPFEDRKFIQSVCTSEGVRIKAGQIDTSNPQSWIYKDSERKRYRFDFNQLPDDIRL